MIRFISIIFIGILIASINEQGFAREDQEGEAGIGLRGLRAGAWYSHQTNPSQIAKNHRAGNARILNGVRRLVPQDYITIQSAIDASVDGDTVLVSDGTYVENIRFRGKAIVVASLYIVDSLTSHIEQTIIDGSNPSDPDSASVVYFINGEDTTSVLCGFTVTGGAGTPWTSPDQIVWRSGGGVFCVGAFGATIVSNHIAQNRISGENALGGGVFFFGNQSFLILENNHIFGNRVSANPGLGWGGGAEIIGDGLFARIVENVFEQDSVIAQDIAASGGLDVVGVGLLVGGIVQGNVFRENIADATVRGGVGGGLTFYGTSAMQVRDNLFEGNIARSRDGWGEGAGFVFEDTGVIGYGRKIVVGNQFINNLASSQFGNGRGGAIELYNSLATISGNYFEQNTALGGTAVGGAIRIFSSAFLLENNICRENTALYGGAIHISGTPQSGTDLDIINNTIVNNTASSTGGGIDVSGVPVVVVNSILWGNTPNPIGLGTGGSVQVRYSDIQGGWSGDGNIDADPLLEADTLTNASPCIGAGVDSVQIGGIWYYAPHFDFDGDPRPMPVSSMPDMGAQESDYVTGIFISDARTSPHSFSLSQNYPNPFNPTTTFEFSLPQSDFVTLKVYNILGEEVATLVSERLPAGKYNYDWDAGNLASGVFLYKIQAGNYVETKKMLLIR